SAAPSSGGSGSAYVASSYDSLVDAPLEMGVFEESRAQAGGREIRIVVHGDTRDQAKFTDELTRIVNYETALMGDAPFPQFLFIIHVGSIFGGGAMEHANSTAISADVPNQVAAYSA